MIYGMEGFEKQEKTGLEWLNKAAAKNHPRALYELHPFYNDGLLAPLLRKSQEKSNELLLKSANLGFARANSELAKCYCNGANGFEQDVAEAYFRYSVAFALDEKNHHAALGLGLLHYYEDIPAPSTYLACYYLNIAANYGDDGFTDSACFLYGMALARLDDDFNYGIPMFSMVPAVLFWARKSNDRGFSDAKEFLKKADSNGRTFCANCSEEAQADEKFKQCSKCRADWYCSKECQVEAWRAGHKNDCKRARIPKFEDYLNAA